ncbi:hypothetical protein AAG570_008367 [Ranatra chinensis]|uniref:Zinc finger PHD-type domain-containing protein n=1 Tax=Ranatra chinensis TaxID=642074 RepID=A0ABD0XVL2_9HEMI
MCHLIFLIKFLLQCSVPCAKKPRTSEDFYLFCKFILEYENYGLTNKEGSPNLSAANPPEIIPLSVKSPVTEDEFEAEDSSDEDSYDIVTCFCKKPFAGRPMIECSKCLTWIHLSCAKVRKSHIPDVYICPSCKEDSTL